MTRPSLLPRWCTTGTRVAPPEGTKDTGWLVNNRVPAQFLNWLQGVSYDWLNYLAGRITADFVQAADAYDVGIGAGLGGELVAQTAAGTYLPVHCDDPTQDGHAVTRSYRKSGARIFSLAGALQSIGATTTTDVAITAAAGSFNQGGVVTTGTSPNKFTAVTAGLYEVYGMAAMESNASSYWSISPVTTGDWLLPNYHMRFNPDGPSSVQFYDQVRLDVGEYVKLTITNNAASPKNLDELVFGIRLLAP